jgi:hypothetical protein
MQKMAAARCLPHAASESAAPVFCAFVFLEGKGEVGVVVRGAWRASDGAGAAPRSNNNNAPTCTP